MHEMSIAVGVIEQVLAVADEHRARRVDEVELTVGVMRQVVPEALQTAFEVVSTGTVAEGAALKITEEPAAAECRNCGRSFGCTVHDFRCPGCGQADVHVTAGKDIVLKSIACRTEGGVSA